MSNQTDLIKYLSNTPSKDKEEFNLVKKEIPNGYFGDNLRNGQVYENIIVDFLLQLSSTKDVGTNDDDRFDLQVTDKEGKRLRIESKFHSPKYGNVCIVVYENDKWKQWLYKSELYCASYYEDDKLYNSYVRVSDFINLLKTDKLTSYKKVNMNHQNRPYHSYIIPTKMFRELFCTFSMVVSNKYLTRELFDKSIVSILPKQVKDNLQSSILNSIVNLSSFKDKTNDTYVDSFTNVGHTNTMTVNVSYLDDIIHILKQIGFTESEIIVEDTKDSTYVNSKNYNVDVYCRTNRTNHIHRLIARDIIQKSKSYNKQLVR